MSDPAASDSSENDAFLFIRKGAFDGIAGELRFELVDLKGSHNDVTIVSGDIEAMPPRTSRSHSQDSTISNPQISFCRPACYLRSYNWSGRGLAAAGGHIRH